MTEIMKASVKEIYGELFERYPSLRGEAANIASAFEILRRTYKNGGKVLCCGNGGSCADSEHIVGELMKSFKIKREIGEELRGNLSKYGEYGAALARDLEGTLPAVSLCGHAALTTAYLNDTNPQLTFAQQLFGLAKTGDALITLTTSGNSQNCIYAAVAARALGVSVVALTGSNGGKIAQYADTVINAPEKETFKVQEYHLPIYHALCAMLEAEFFA